MELDVVTRLDTEQHQLILSFLPNLHDHLRAGLVCRRWAEIFFTPQLRKVRTLLGCWFEGKKEVTIKEGEEVTKMEEILLVLGTKGRCLRVRRSLVYCFSEAP